MNDFHNTRMGQQFYSADVPAISRALERISDNLARIATALETRPVDGPTAALLTEAAKAAPRFLGDLMDEELASQIAYYESPEGAREQALKEAAMRLRLKTDAAYAKAARKEARIRAAAAALKKAELTIIGSADAGA
jgi:hypothetical protein